MDVLEKTFRNWVKEFFSPEKMTTMLIARQLDKQDIKLSKEQFDKVEASLRNLEGDSLTIQIDDPGLKVEQGRLMVQLDDPDEIDSLINKVRTELAKAFPHIVTKVSNLLLKELKRDAPRMLEERRQERKAFEAQLFQEWRRALNLLEMFIVIAFEAGAKFNEEFRPQAAKDDNFVFEVLTRLHARACQVAQEVLVLLQSGFADGAHARWRTLHEIAVVAWFVKKHGNDVAERYLLHTHIESYRAAVGFQEYHERLHQRPIPEQDLADLKAIYEQLITRFGREYTRPYGWASAALGNQNPKFYYIEEAVGFKHWRPYYGLAGQNVHAKPKGVLFRLGLSTEDAPLLLAGPSNAGLSDPGHGVAIALAQTTVTLLTSTTKVPLDNVVLCQVIIKLLRRIGREFIIVDRRQDLTRTVISRRPPRRGPRHMQHRTTQALL